jgi:hypothetical protein
MNEVFDDPQGVPPVAIIFDTHAALSLELDNLVGFLVCLAKLSSERG